MPSVCPCYIDNFYNVFDRGSSSLKFLQMLNSQHAAVKFTTEKETNSKSLTFLDIQIQLTDKEYDTCVWRKPTNTGLLLNYKANLPVPRHGNLVLLLCFLNRAKIYALHVNHI